ncbi:MAG: transaldolase [Calditrichaeota bacterium]|nr:transaldolase [Calditrichota bacterium]
MSKIKKLADLGQSIWLDYIQRSLITSGELKSLIDEGLRGITTNPSIFEKAIAKTDEYDNDLEEIPDKDSLEAVLEKLMFKDISMATDMFDQVYKETNRLDGYVSAEVNPDLAYDTEKTISEGTKIFNTINRPNVMVKVPATEPGLAAITELISRGINVNVTLIFGMENYKAVANAYILGLEKYLEKNPTERLDKIASVASFFISRIDSAVDAKVENKPELMGKAAIANARLVYREFKDIFSGGRWQKLADKGARIQRTLWASTSTKNPSYPDTLYVDELIGADTVNTLPPATYNQFKDHGTVTVTIENDIKGAENYFEDLKAAGIDFNAITEKLQVDGVDLFSKSYHSLLNSLQEKIKTVA